MLAVVPSYIQGSAEKQARALQQLTNLPTCEDTAVAASIHVPFALSMGSTSSCRSASAASLSAVLAAASVMVPMWSCRTHRGRHSRQPLLQPVGPVQAKRPLLHGNGEAVRPTTAVIETLGGCLKYKDDRPVIVLLSPAVLRCAGLCAADADAGPPHLHQLCLCWLLGHKI